MARRVTLIALLVMAAAGRAFAIGTPNYTNSMYPSRTVELYDPGVGTWSSTAPLQTSRAGHASVVLASGHVLVAGGVGLDGSALKAAELYDPTTETWSEVPAADLYVGTLVELPSHRVLAIGRTDSAEGAAQLFDPITRTWTAPEPWTVAGLMATRLTSGSILVDGTALYDETGGGWRSIQPVPVGVGATILALAPLHDGTALAIASDWTAEIFDPATDTWRATGALVPISFTSQFVSGSSVGRHAVLLLDGKVLTTVVAHYYAPLNSWPWDSWQTELYDPATGAWQLLTGPGDDCGAMALLPSGHVLVSGGGINGWPTDSAQLYDPIAIHWQSTGVMQAARTDHTATVLRDGRVLVAGGMQTVLITVPDSAVVNPGERVKFVAWGGAKYSSGSAYYWSIGQNQSGGTIDPHTGEYVAGCGRDVSVTDSVEVRDGVHLPATAQVNVRAGAFSVSPSESTATPGQTIAFASSCGGAANRWSLETNVSGATIDPASGAYVAGSTCTGGTSKDVIKVTALTGRTALATVTIPCAPQSSGGCGSAGGGSSPLGILVLVAIGAGCRMRRRTRS